MKEIKNQKVEKGKPASKSAPDVSQAGESICPECHSAGVEDLSAACRMCRHCGWSNGCIQ